jgi:uncharacterized protein
MTGDVAGVAAEFGAVLREAGVLAGADRCERFARAVLLVRPGDRAGLLECAVATLAGSREEAGTLARVFDATFGGLELPPEDGETAAGGRDKDGPGMAGDAGVETLARLIRAARERPGPRIVQAREVWEQAGTQEGRVPEGGVADGGRPDATGMDGSELDGSERDSSPDGTGAGEPERDGGPDRAAGDRVRGVASGAERLAGTDFAELSGDELVQLAGVMRRLTLAVPVRRSRRPRQGARGRQADLRATLRRARQSGAEPFRIIKKSQKQRPRKLVVLCDISGSMEPYARAMLQLLYCAAGGARAEVFSFATRLTRLTRALAEPEPGLALRRAGQAAPDWLGGTRIGVSLREFNDSFGQRGLARGAVVVIVSDGWDTGDPAAVRREMARLSRVAFRIVWVNPRTHRPGYRPLAGGMAAAWPFCDAVVSAHRLDALGELTAALADPVRRRARDATHEAGPGAAAPGPASR